ncbi:MAG: mandelate racemase/muconate lactonizing enzyme family protein, partial [Nocardioidaceae bacterium]
LQEGLTAVKTKVGFGEAQDRATLAEARAALGDGPALFADANQAWNLGEAQAMADVLSQHRVEWLEEPLEGDDLAELEKLSAEASIPIATGENLYGASTFDRYLDSSAIRIIQPDLAKSGGLTMGAHVARRAARTNTSVGPHCYSSAVGIAAGLQLAAAYASVQWIELDVRENPLRTDLLRTPLRLEGGALVVPQGDGLGIELDRDVVNRYQTHVEERTRHDL